MRKLRIYLDTSVINFLFADDAPEKREITVRFFDGWVATGRYETAISPVVVREIARTEDAGDRARLLDVIAKYSLKSVPLVPRTEVAHLADAYVAAKVIPAKKYEDALHVALCTIHELDVLVSWNFHHLANVNKERRITAVNQSLGYYYPLRITTPLEVMDEG
jgi:predicted nucleic acid-binding protein